jgi:hypothetical protein
VLQKHAAGLLTVALAIPVAQSRRFAPQSNSGKSLFEEK